MAAALSEPAGPPVRWAGVVTRAAADGWEAAAAGRRRPGSRSTGSHAAAATSTWSWRPSMRTARGRWRTSTRTRSCESQLSSLSVSDTLTTRLAGPRPARRTVHLRGRHGHGSVGGRRGHRDGDPGGRRGRLRRLGARGAARLRGRGHPHDDRPGALPVIGEGSAPRPLRGDRYQTGFFQPRRPAFWLYLIVVAGTRARWPSPSRASSDGSPWAAGRSRGPCCSSMRCPSSCLVYFLDLYEREPLSVVLAALIWGAVAATTLAGFANVGWGLVVSRAGGPEFAARWTAALTAPFVEETLKGLGVVLIYLIAARRDRRRDGRVRLRRGVRAGLRGRRGRLLLHERVRRASRGRAARVPPARRRRAACTPTSSTRAWSAWASATSVSRRSQVPPAPAPVGVRRAVRARRLRPFPVGLAPVGPVPPRPAHGVDLPGRPCWRRR